MKLSGKILQNNSVIYEYLEGIYKKYNNNSFIQTDPIFFPKRYEDPKDIEIIAFISSAFAFGRVLQINKILTNLINTIGKRPYKYFSNFLEDDFDKSFINFRYRFVDFYQLKYFFFGISSIIKKYGTIENCFLTKNETIWDGLTSIYKSFENGNYLIPNPEKGSACKRFNLFLRWMVRYDNIDFGIWKRVKKSDLILPCDTHIFEIGKKLNFTKRKTISRKTAIEITDGFKKLNPKDPVKYDFALTRAGILENNNFLLQV